MRHRKTERRCCLVELYIIKLYIIRINFRSTFDSLVHKKTLSSRNFNCTAQKAEIMIRAKDNFKKKNYKTITADPDGLISFPLTPVFQLMNKISYINPPKNNKLDKLTNSLTFERRKATDHVRPLGKFNPGSSCVPPLSGVCIPLSLPASIPLFTAWWAHPLWPVYLLHATVHLLWKTSKFQLGPKRSSSNIIAITGLDYCSF